MIFLNIIRCLLYLYHYHQYTDMTFAHKFNQQETYQHNYILNINVLNCGKFVMCTCNVQLYILYKFVISWCFWYTQLLQVMRIKNISKYFIYNTGLPYFQLIAQCCSFRVDLGRTSMMYPKYLLIVFILIKESICYQFFDLLTFPNKLIV